MKVKVMMMPTHAMMTIPEKYLVTISYDEVYEIFDDKALYDQVEKGDEVEIELLK